MALEIKDRDKALKLALAAIEKSIGKGTVLVGQEAVPGVEFISTGCPFIDQALGGGLAKGRLVEIYGPESSGKTTIALESLAATQRAGGVCALVDAEHALAPDYATNLGVDMDSLLVSQPSCGEDALEVVRQLTMSGTLSLIVVDSVAALVPRAELEGKIGDQHVGQQARLMGQAMRLLDGIAHSTNTTIFFINQIRQKVQSFGYGDPNTTPGGLALKFYASQRMDIRRIGGVKQGEDLVANSTKLKVVKNKVAPPYKEVVFDIRYGEGVDKVGYLIDEAIKASVLEKSGTWIMYKGKSIGQGKNGAREALMTNSELLQEIAEQI